VADNKRLMDGLKMGTVASALYVGGALAVRKTSWSVGTRGGVQAVAGLGLYLALGDRMPNVANGALAYAFVAGVQGLAEELELRQWLENATNAPAAIAATGTTAATTPATLPATTTTTPTTTGTASTPAALTDGRSGGALGAAARANYQSLFGQVYAAR
jgi:hypothetical protein